MVRKSIERNIKQIGTNLSTDAIKRIKGEKDNGWLDDSVIDCAQTLKHSQFSDITKPSRNFHGLADERQLRTFHETFTELSWTYGRTAITVTSRNSHRFTNVTDLSWIIMVTGHKNRAIYTCKIPIERCK